MKKNIVMTLLYLNEYSQIILGIGYIALLKFFTPTFNDTRRFVLKAIVFLVLANALFWFGLDCVMFLNERYFYGYKVTIGGVTGLAEEVVIIVIIFMSLPLLGINKLLKLFQGRAVHVTSYITLFCLIYYLTSLASDHLFGFR
jgi:hypothetical protein